MVPVSYLIALIVTLIVILNNIKNVFYPKKDNILRNMFVSFLLPSIWIYAFFGYNTTFTILLGIICGLFGVVLYILYGSNEGVKEEVEPEVALNDFIGLTGQVCFIQEGNKYIGILDNTDKMEVSGRQIEFICQAPMEKYDHFRISDVADGHFVGEKITNL